MAGRAGQLVVPFGHEGDRLAVQMGDLLGAVLVDDVPVGHLQGVGIADVDLLLARPPFALGVLHRNRRGIEAGADCPHHRLFLAGLQDVVVLNIGAGGRKVPQALVMGAPVGLVEQVEFQLRGHQRPHVQRRKPCHLALEDGAR